MIIDCLVIVKDNVFWVCVFLSEGLNCILINDLLVQCLFIVSFITLPQHNLIKNMETFG